MCFFYSSAQFVGYFNLLTLEQQYLLHRTVALYSLLFIFLFLNCVVDYIYLLICLYVPECVFKLLSDYN